MWPWSKQREDDLQRELQSDLDLEAEDHEARGLSPEAARHAAQRAFGNAAYLQEETRAAWGWTWLERLLQDLRYAARMLRKAPAFTSVAALSLALGIGANTAVFSVLDAVLLKSLPVKDAGQLRIFAWIRHGEPAGMQGHSGYTMYDDHGARVDGSFSYPAYQELAAKAPQFSALVAFAANQFSITAGGATDVAFGHYVSGNYFTGLGAAPLIGRSLLPEDDAPSSPRVIVLTYQYWTKRFAGDPSVIGRVIQLNRIPVTVIAVMPPAFQGLQPGRAIDVFLPMTMVAETGPVYFPLTKPEVWWVQVFGRLKPGASDSAATAAVQTILDHEIDTYTDSARNREKPAKIVLEHGERGIALLRGSAHTPFTVVGVTAALVLLIACINLANLLLARYSARAGELAVRISIGASRTRLIRQMLTENLLLAALGAAAGFLIAKPMVGLLLRFVGGLTELGVDARIDFRTLAFTLALSLLTVAIFGALPAWRATRIGAAAALKDSNSHGHGGTRFNPGRYLVSVQIALSIMLLVGAGLFLRTLHQLVSVNLGFATDHLLTFQTDPVRAGYKFAQVTDVYRRIERGLSSIPGVERVAISQLPLIGGVVTNGGVQIPGVEGEKPAHFLMVSDAFLTTTGIPLVHGRDLDRSDFELPAPSAVVNESFANQYLPRQNPLGRVFFPPRWGGDNAHPIPFTIVGVVRDAHYSGVRAEVPPTAYVPFPYRYTGDNRMVFYIRTRVEPLSLAAEVRRAVAAVDPHLPVAELRTEQDQIDRSISNERMFAALITAFGSIALILAAIGIYGVMAFSVARRTSEIGVRMALGAQRSQVVAMVLRQSAWLSVLGVAAGVPAALWLVTFVKKLLFGVKPTDPLSIAAAVLVMLAVAVLAAWIPARRASRVDPLKALRYE